MSIAVENFVKTIYQSEQHPMQETKPGEIAKKLGITNAAATDMAKKLAEKNLIKYQPYKPLELTVSGRKMAISVIRKHRLWEAFLFRLFDMSLHEIHRESELLEHQTSDFLAEKIHAFLGYPTLDPHGDPIPDAEGEIQEMPGLLLGLAKENQKYKIVRLIGHGEEFFELCAQNGLQTEQEILLEKHFLQNEMSQLKVQERTIIIPKYLSNQIWVQYVE